MEKRLARVKQTADSGIPMAKLNLLKGKNILVTKELGRYFWVGGTDEAGEWEWYDTDLEFFPDGKVIENAPE
jgi:hypothetical protein